MNIEAEKNSTGSLIGATEEDQGAARRAVEQARSTLGVQRKDGNPFYVYFDKGKVTSVRPNDIPLADVKKR